MTKGTENVEGTTKYQPCKSSENSGFWSRRQLSSAGLKTLHWEQGRKLSDSSVVRRQGSGASSKTKIPEFH